MQREQVQTNEAQAGGAERLGTGTAARLVALCALIAATLAFVVPSAVAQVDTSGDGQGRVVNGTVVVAGEVPYHVGFVYPDGEYWGCGGSIVNSRTIVTAEHCFPPEESTEGVFVRAGVINVASTMGQDIAIAEIRLHPTPGDISVGDIAIVHLASDLTFNANVASVLIPTPDEVVYGGEAVVSGWGLTSEGGVGSDLLLAAAVTLIDDATCPGLNLGDLNPSAEICASSSPGDTCQNDSGGPMVQASARGSLLVGITSWGWQCGPPNPGIYTDVAEFGQWIADNLAPGTTAPHNGGGPVEPPPAGALCANEVVTVDLGAGQLPTGGDDVILGTPGDDVIAAGAGNDIVCGGGGNDSIWGQAGLDDLYGGDGDDKLRGGDDDDVLIGGDGVDDIAGGRGNDFIEGGAGDDKVLRGGTGDDDVSGGDGNDLLIAGNGGEDVVSGNAGNDKVTGGPRPDTVLGGAGNDEVRGLGGADQLFGGAGDDSLFGGKQPDQLDGGEGIDACNGGTTGNDAPEGDVAVACENELVNIP